MAEFFIILGKIPLLRYVLEGRVQVNPQHGPLFMKLRKSREIFFLPYPGRFNKANYGEIRIDPLPKKKSRWFLQILFFMFLFSILQLVYPREANSAPKFLQGNSTGRSGPREDTFSPEKVSGAYGIGFCPFSPHSVSFLPTLPTGNLFVKAGIPEILRDFSSFPFWYLSCDF